MSEGQKSQRSARRQRCIAAGLAKVISLRAGSCNDEEVAELRRAVLAGDCPLCGESGFKNIALHVQLIHDVASRELRDLLLLTFTESICSKELHDALSELNAGKNPRSIKAPDGSKMLSRKARLLLSEKPRPHWPLPKEVLRRNGQRVGSGRAGVRRSAIQHGTRNE